MIAYSVILLIGAVLFFRAAWINYHLSLFQIKYFWFVLSKTVIDGYSNQDLVRLYPDIRTCSLTHILLEFWRWDYNRYFFDQKFINEVEALFAENVNIENFDQKYAQIFLKETSSDKKDNLFK